MKIHDITPTVDPSLPVWPGDTPFSFRRVMEIAHGASCNVTTVETTVHVGAHADAPLHFRDGADDAASVPLEKYLGPCRVVTLLGREPITAERMAALALAGTPPRVVFRTRKPDDGEPFATGFSHLTPSAADRLASLGVVLCGIDTPSMDAFDSKDLPAHRRLLDHGIAILEGLALDGVEDGDYTLVALPLKLAGVDASPVRAVLLET